MKQFFKDPKLKLEIDNIAKLKRFEKFTQLLQKLTSLKKKKELIKNV